MVRPVTEVVHYWNSDGFPAIELQVVFVPSRPNHSRIQYAASDSNVKNKQECSMLEFYLQAC